MTVELFLTLLSIFSTLTALIVEAVKKLVEDKQITISYNFVALIVALIVGIGGTFAYYYIGKIAITGIECLYAFFMGLASALCSMLGFDKVKQLIDQMKVW
ncbi:MAG: hypothetical protein KBT03_12835 [Bacteroidales bacterium]|nr:hypothetical protein [Candidatus Scybalousia scybalohippi]